MVVNYNYCPNAVVDPATGETLPCGNIYFSEDSAMINQVDYDDPCATGGCLISPACESGECRLAQLGGRWACCRCGGGGNEYRWCQHRLRASPDTFCYHVCCDACRPDPQGSAPGSDHNATTTTSSFGSPVLTPTPPPMTTIVTPTAAYAAAAAAAGLFSPGVSSSSSAPSKRQRRR
ncbi:hypothetical protein VTH82DRAFT_5502 [Thermothelomyces myriococcoides]